MFVIIFIAILLVFIIHVISKRQHIKKINIGKTEQYTETVKFVSDMVDKYNAISDWANLFDGRFSVIDTTCTVKNH